MPSTTESSFNHARLRQWREQSGLRAEEVAARSGTSFSHLRALEAGEVDNPGGLVLARIAAVYGRSLDELFTGAGQ
jgi:transcriptional regulator with XRE-family HTH domain